MSLSKSFARLRLVLAASVSGLLACVGGPNNNDDELDQAAISSNQQYELENLCSGLVLETPRGCP